MGRDARDLVSPAVWLHFVTQSAQLTMGNCGDVDISGCNVHFAAAEWVTISNQMFQLRLLQCQTSPTQDTAMNLSLSFRLIVVLGLFSIVSVTTEIGFTAEPGFSIKREGNKIAVLIGDKPFAEYVANDPATNKSYLWPVFGPGGVAMTRDFPMKDIEGEVKDHYHHRGLWFGHEDIGGFDSWTERGTFDKGDKTSEANKERIAKLGKQVHRKFGEVSASPDKATIVSEIDYMTPDGKKSVTEIQTLIFRVEGNLRLIDFNQDFVASEGDVTFGDKKDAGLCIRVPTTMSVDSKLGGRILNSEGLTDAAAWGQRAKWCDYSGSVAKSTHGVAILNHPTSFRYPTTWHVRTYGLFTANPFGTLDPKSPNGPHTLRAGETMKLRHRFVFHEGDAASAKIEEAYSKYIKN